MDDILNLSDEGDKGYTFEVDLNIPNHLHDTFKIFHYVRIIIFQILMNYLIIKKIL